MFAADCVRGDDSFVGMRRGHPDVDDCCVWALQAHGAEERGGVVGLADDIDAGACE
jgi:hypothetical protein